MAKSDKLPTPENASPVDVPKSLAARVCAIMGAAHAIPKSGENKFHGYKYIKDSDLAESMRKLLAQFRVACFSTIESIETIREYQTSNSKVQFLTRVKVKFTLVNADNPDEKQEAFYFGDGVDGEDKGLTKALTNCQKYFFLKTFCVGADDDADPEADVATPVGAPVAKGAAPAAAPRRAVGSTVYEYKLVSGPDFDRAKARLKDRGFRWNSTNKTWVGSELIADLEAYLFAPAKAPSAPVAAQQTLAAAAPPIDDDMPGWMTYEGAAPYDPGADDEQ